MATWEEMTAVTGASFQTLVLVEARRRAGHVEKALREMDRGLALAERINERCFVPEMHRRKRNLLLTETGAAFAAGPEAGRWLQSAWRTARQQGARAWELRAVISLARPSESDSRH